MNSGRRTTNATAATQRIAGTRSTIRRVRRDGAVTDARWFMSPLQTAGRCDGVCDFPYVRDTRNPHGAATSTRSGAATAPRLPPR